MHSSRKAAMIHAVFASGLARRQGEGRRGRRRRDCRSIPAIICAIGAAQPLAWPQSTSTARSASLPSAFKTTFGGSIFARQRRRLPPHPTRRLRYRGPRRLPPLLCRAGARTPPAARSPPARPPGRPRGRPSRRRSTKSSVQLLCARRDGVVRCGGGVVIALDGGRGGLAERRQQPPLAVGPAPTERRRRTSLRARRCGRQPASERGGRFELARRGRRRGQAG